MTLKVEKSRAIQAFSDQLLSLRYLERYWPS